MKTNSIISFMFAKNFQEATFLVSKSIYTNCILKLACFISYVNKSNNHLKYNQILYHYLNDTVNT